MPRCLQTHPLALRLGSKLAWLWLVTLCLPCSCVEIFATVIDGTDSYLPGVQALATSLLDHNNTRPLVVVTTGPPSQGLTNAAACLNFSIFQTVGVDNPYDESHWMIKQAGNTFIKLIAFTLSAKRVVLMDADMVVLRNLDALFSSSLETAPVLQAVPDIDIRRSFNTGLMVITPRYQLAKHMYEQLHRGIDPDDPVLLDGTDQGFLNRYFHWLWLNKPDRVKLPLEFNTVKRLETDAELYWRKFSTRWIRVLHFVGEKPWTDTEDNVKYPISFGVWKSAYASFQKRCPNPLRRTCARDSDSRVYGTLRFKAC
eukprot:TRINITY_DN6401_c0_g1_i1.p1 TRINITY_DN6401_c0_g1~~TRINITY_DN6401_c0_g1_i1.p1  ORF type:complete len:313 (-),score=42.35 TRINITY_DN6401_c0_g1_i1:32-970(-)